ncbi:hypothetical protein JCM21900_006444 [Sporobolomyces salmonicolor]
MKLPTSLALLGAAAITRAAPPPFVVQNPNSIVEPAAQPPLADLTVDDFHAVQSAIKESVDNLLRLEDDRVVEDEQQAGELDSPQPHHPPHFLDFSDYTVLEIVNASLGHHHEHEKSDREGEKEEPAAWPRSPFPEGHEHDPKYLPLHRLAWLVNFSSDAQELLKQDGITLLAPDDHALTPPHRRHHRGPPRAQTDYDVPSEEPENVFAAEKADLERFAALPHPFHSHEFSPKKLSTLMASDAEGDDEKKKLFQKIIAIFGKYHVIPETKTGRELADVTTVPTLLTDSRVNVQPTFHWFPFPHPGLKFNYYAYKKGPTILAKNGVIHLIGAPLFPPLTPLNELFLFPQYFSSLTSAIQKVDLDEPLLPSHGRDDDLANAEPSSMVSELVQELAAEHEIKDFTIFAPSNRAFAKLPPKILAFLHSPFPFSKKVLKYLLSYHIVPDLVFFSDYLKNDTDYTGLSEVEKYVASRETDVEVPVEWLAPADRHVLLRGRRSPHREHDVVEREEWKVPPFPPRGPQRRPPPLPPRGAPSRPPRGGPHHPHHPGANVTHYVLPTLLTAENANATLKVAVVSYHVGPHGKGPIKRSIIVFPALSLPPKHSFEGEGEGEGEGEEKSMCPHKKEHGPHLRPIKVSYADIPARSGALHVLGDGFLVPPPPPHHHDEDDFKLTDAAKHEAKKMRKALARIFA